MVESVARTVGLALPPVARPSFPEALLGTILVFVPAPSEQATPLAAGAEGTGYRTRFLDIRPALEYIILVLFLFLPRP